MRRGRLKKMSKVRDVVDVVDCERCRNLSDEHRVFSPTSSFVGDNYVIPMTSCNQPLPYI